MLTDYHKYPQEYLIYESNYNNKLNFVNHSLSLGYFNSLMKGSNLFYGDPPELLFLEDLCLRLSLNTLKNIFAKTITFIAEEGNNTNIQPRTDERLLLSYIKEKASELFTELLCRSFKK